MKKFVLMTSVASLMAMQLHAGGDIAPQEPVVEEAEMHEHAESDFYAVVKGLRITGDRVDHEGAILDGDSGYGFGIDLGYRLGNGFAVEYDFAYAKNTVSELDEFGAVVAEGDAKYYSHALDLVYTYELTETVGVFAKAGYEYEIEKIAEYNIDADDHGFNFGIGTEVAMGENYKFVAEYEHSTIEGPKGNAIFVGIMINF
ncbi:porin family protein [Sulfurovum sp. zt1-1]|uniref:Porin family protein n=1 Tax=Sulfurovum zhangzhouensis TaxID=3019067 RepID=A0ABT7QVA0_9BACT|nr:porin family protein [Sulfurovum zhangzhouensis]MDM5270760.1 porin family protein [Sulfurovum zhangzhouensis]